MKRCLFDLDVFSSISHSNFFAMIWLFKYQSDNVLRPLILKFCPFSKLTRVVGIVLVRIYLLINR